MQLVELDTEYGLDQVGITNLFRVSQQQGGNLGIEHRGGQAAPEVKEDLHILPSGMHDLGDALIVDNIEQWRQVSQCQRIDTGNNVGGRNLQQAELRIIGFFAEELGIQCYPVSSSERGTETIERIGRIDIQNVVCRGHSKRGLNQVSPSTSSTSICPVMRRRICDQETPMARTPESTARTM